MMVLAFVVALTLSGQNQPPALPLVITRMWIDRCDPHQPDTGNPRVELRNIGPRTILAWGVTFKLKGPNREIEPGGLEIDAASSLPADRKSSVAPGATSGVPNCGGRVVPADTLISDGAVTFVIFDDDTALGDERQIALAFDRRRTNQVFWQKMQLILNDAAAHDTDPAAVLSGIRHGMEAETDPQFRSLTYYQWFLNAMSPRLMALTTPQAVLERFRSLIPAQRANADDHAVRR